MSLQDFNTLVGWWMLLAVLLLPVQLFITAPYGRHVSTRWGPLIDNRLGWVVMEIVSPVALLVPVVTINSELASAAVFFVVLWLLHYGHRALVFPFRTRTAGKRIPVFIVLSAVAFNAINGFLNGYYLTAGWGHYTVEWFSDPRFVIGVIVFVTGASINLWADTRLIALRKDGDGTYKIPRGGLFERISCPNHLGEIIQWTGFAIMCWNLPALAFAVWTAANLVPRALSHHAWYRRTFADYPQERAALIPGVL